jgi:hypothetical protein
MLAKVVWKLRSHPIARVKFPDTAKMREFADMVHEREPLVDNIIGFMDGVSFSPECTDEHIKQNGYYCEYDCNMMENNVFAYGPDGIFFCGNQHSREMGGG